MLNRHIYNVLILLFPASLVSEEGVHQGKIVVKSKNSQFKATVPYRATVLKGALRVNHTCTHFLLEGETRHDLSKKNHYYKKTRLKILSSSVSYVLPQSKTQALYVNCFRHSDSPLPQVYRLEFQNSSLFCRKAKKRRHKFVSLYPSIKSNEACSIFFKCAHVSLFVRKWTPYFIRL